MPRRVPRAPQGAAHCGACIAPDGAYAVIACRLPTTHVVGYECYAPGGALLLRLDDRQSAIANRNSRVCHGQPARLRHRRFAVGCPCAVTLFFRNRMTLRSGIALFEGATDLRLFTDQCLRSIETPKSKIENSACHNPPGLWPRRSILCQIARSDRQHGTDDD